jgi:uncharacterized protein YuzE
MRITYDVEVDVLDISLTEKGHDRAASREVLPGVYLSVTPKGQLINIEMLDASRHLPMKELEELPSPVGYMTPNELARDSGLKAGTIADAAAAGKIEGVIKRGRIWRIPSAAFANYLERRSPSGRLPKSKKGRKERRDLRRFRDSFRSDAISE